MFEVCDNKTFFSKRFQVDADPRGAIHIVGLPSGCLTALIVFVTVAIVMWGFLAVLIITSSEQVDSDMSYDYHFGMAVAGVTIGAGVSALSALLGLAWVKRPKRRRAERAFDELADWPPGRLSSEYPANGSARPSPIDGIADDRSLRDPGVG